MSLDPIESFKVSNVRLSASQLQTAERIESIEITKKTSLVQARRWVTHYFSTYELEGNSGEFLLAQVHLGLRVVARTAQDDGEGSSHDLQVLCAIEATITVEFEVLKREFDEAELQDFLDRNAVHIAWPFWREHVFSTLRAASLPMVEVPLLAGVAKQRKTPSKEIADDPALSTSKTGTVGPDA